MKYVGSKRKYKNELLKIMLQYRKPGQYFIEPFCGSCSVIQEVDKPRIASDNNYFLIELLKAIEKGWIPPDNLSEEQYKQIKSYSDLLPACLVGFTGFCCSYAGKWWGGYARGNDNKGNPRNYCGEQKRDLLKQAPKLKGIDFRYCDYKSLEIPPNSLIYCDPPYANTTKYATSKGFNHQEFWEWCRKKYHEGHTLFISEYVAPSDFEVVWTKKVTSSLDKDTGGKTAVEKLFVYKDQLCLQN